MMVGLAGAAESQTDPDAPKLKPDRKWVYVMANFGVNDRTEAAITLLRRAKKAGYNGMVVSDVKFEKFQLATPDLLANVKRFRHACTEEGMELIACVAPFGYADYLLSNDPNLAEGMPVHNASFIVKGGKLVPFDDVTKLVNGNLEDWKGDVPTGWDVEKPGAVSFREGDRSAQTENRSSTLALLSRQCLD